MNAGHGELPGRPVEKMKSITIGRRVGPALARALLRTSSRNNAALTGERYSRSDDQFRHCVGTVMYIQCVVAVCLALCALAGEGMAQTAPRLTTNPNETSAIPDPTRINEGTVTVITAPAGGATSVFGSDMARVLDDEA